MFATKAASFAGEAAALQEDNGTPRQSLALSNVNLGAFFDKLLRFFLQPDFKRVFLWNFLLRGEFPHILRYFHAASAFAKASAWQENAGPHAFE